MDTSLDRRSFLKFAAIAGAGASAIGLVGCSSAASEGAAADAELEDIEITETIDCDMIVAGSGAAGLATALRAKEAGIDRVVLLEKRDIFGGTAYLAGGCFAAESVLQKEAGITVTKDEIFQKCMAYHNWANNARVLRRYVDNADGMIDWLLEEGVEFDDVERTGISEQTWHIPMGRMAGLMDTLYENAQNAGVEFVFGTAAKQLLMEDGKVAGVVAVTEDGGVQYNAPVVALCTGGYANNKEMFEQYTGWKGEDWNPLGNIGRDGDGINMGLSANAALHIPGAVMVCGYTVSNYDSFGDPIAITAAWQPSVWVNENGIRFADESITGNFSAAGAASATVNDVYSVFDKGYMDMLINEGLIVGPNNIYAPGTKLEGLYEQFDEVYESGDENLFKADSLEELAEAMGIDVETFVATIDEYNTYGDNGGDPIFGKTAEYCRPLVEAPFYAFKMNRTFFTTVGGLKVDEQCRVIDEAGQPIPGLYAGGSDTGGLYGYQYDVLVAAGSQCGWGLTGAGFIVESALEYMGA